MCGFSSRPSAQTPCGQSCPAFASEKPRASVNTPPKMFIPMSANMKTMRKMSRKVLDICGIVRKKVITMR